MSTRLTLPNVFGWLAIVVAILALALINLHWLTTELDLSGSADLVSKSPGDSAKGQLVLTQLELATSATLARPLFAKSRRPPKQLVRRAPSRPAVTAQPPLPTQVPRLIAVSIVGDRRAVLLASASTQSFDWIVEGATTSGWTVSAVEPDAAVLKTANRTVTVKLYEKDASAPR